MSKDRIITQAFFAEIEKTSSKIMPNKIKQRFKDFIAKKVKDFKEKTNPNNPIPSQPMPKPGEKTAQQSVYPDWVLKELQSGIVMKDKDNKDIGNLTKEDIAKFIEKNPPQTVKVPMTDNKVDPSEDIPMTDNKVEPSEDIPMTDNDVAPKEKVPMTDNKVDEGIGSYWKNKKVDVDSGIKNYWNSRKVDVNPPAAVPLWIQKALNTGMDRTDKDGNVIGTISKEDMDKFIEINPGSDSKGNKININQRGKDLSFDRVNPNINTELGADARDNNLFRAKQIRMKRVKKKGSRGA